MSQWNSNTFDPTWAPDTADGQYYTSDPRSFYNSQQQYVGFNEFLDQYQNVSPQYTGSTYGIPIQSAEFQNSSLNNQTALDTFGMNTNQYFNASSVSNNSSGAIGDSNLTDVAHSSNATLENGVSTKMQKGKGKIQPKPQRKINNGHSSTIFKSNLTATASEFIPQNVKHKENEESGSKSPREQKRNTGPKEERRAVQEVAQNDCPASDTSQSQRGISKQGPQSSRYNELTPNSYSSGSRTYSLREDRRENDSSSQDYRSRNQNESRKNNDSRYQNELRNHSGSRRSETRDCSDSRYENETRNQNDVRYDQNNSRNQNDVRYDQNNSRNYRDRDGYKNRQNNGGSYYNQRYRNNESWGSSFRERESEESSYRDRERSYRDRDDRIYRERDDRSYRERDDRRSGYDDYRVGGNVKSPAKHNKYTDKDNSSKPFIKKQIKAEVDKIDSTQRERLTDQLERGVLECLVCCDQVKQTDPVWSCGNCYHVLHLRCIRKWAISSMVESQWRCPACQNLNNAIPAEYRCFCARVRSPSWQRGGVGAHTCGEPCARTRPAPCTHPCTLLCHPGPCPPCHAVVQRHCGCGAETKSVTCSAALVFLCERVCDGNLDCKVHHCKEKCHEGACQPCKEMVTQVCYCPAETKREVGCVERGNLSWSCSSACGRVLACGQHVCRSTCHSGPCQSCPLRPEAVLTCPCGKKKLTEKEKRKSCADPIPLCGNICAKGLPCGPSNDRHFCKLECHDGPCPPCEESTMVPCRCSQISKSVLCVELPEQQGNISCQRKCNKKLTCGRHRCRELCCAATTHQCAVPCRRQLTCGQHRCDQLCHTGYCTPCPRLNFEELRCVCGTAVTYPPVACGTRRPRCDRPCTKSRTCRHPPHHDCHEGPCPPCVVLTTKTCHGQHEERKTIPCHQDEFSCGMPCGKPLPCGKHKCQKVCHTGECATGTCSQPCQELRASCGHPCNAPCHADARGSGRTCPAAAPCRAPVRATCPCRRRTADRTCSENAKDADKIVSGMLASKMQDVTMGNSIDLSDVVARPGFNLKTLECNDECLLAERNRALAMALQIRNPDLGAKLAPRYTEMARQWAARDPSFCTMVHDKLTDLVQLAKKSKQRTRSHSFPSMNRPKRQFVHEMCEHFGCESVAYDDEPNRNVVATADKEKSWLPSMSLLEVVGGKRRVPGPVVSRAPSTPARTAPSTTTQSTANKANGSGWATLTSSYGNVWAARAAKQPSVTPTNSATAATSTQRIDYFDNPPDH